MEGEEVEETVEEEGEEETNELAPPLLHNPVIKIKI